MTRKSGKPSTFQKILFGKKVAFGFNPKMGLFILLVSVPIMGVLRLMASDGENFVADAAWVGLVSVAFALLATFTNYFND